MDISRVLGLTARSNAALAVHPVTGEVAYTVGAVVVLYHARRNKQTRFFVAARATVSVAFSRDGALLAAGERGGGSGTAKTRCCVFEHASGRLVARLRCGGDAPR